MDAEGDSGNIIDSIRTQLEGLKRTEDGSLLYRLIERGLGKRPEDGSSTDEAFLTFMYTLLERYAKNRDGDPITRIKVRVIQQRITPYLMHEDEPDEAPAEIVDEVAAEATEPQAEAAPAEETAAEVNEVEAETVDTATEPEPIVPATKAESGDPEEFDLELIDPEEIDRELQAEEEKAPPVEIPSEPEPARQEAKSKPEAKEPVVKKPETETPKPVKAEPPKKARPAETSGKKKKKEIKEKSTPKPKTAAKKPAQTAKPEKPKKPVKLELVEPTDLTKPPAPIMSAKKAESDEGYIDLGGEEAGAKKSVKNPSQKPAPGSPAKQQAKAPAPPAGKVAKPSQQLMPRGPANKKPESKAASKSGEPSQERVEKLHEAFVHKMAESITRSQEYHRMLRSHMKAIELADNEDDFRDLKSLLMRGIDDLLKGNETLGRDLDSTSHYLKIARLDRALLKDELGRIKNNTTVDELTALQNKDAFIKQLESEISRVNRYGFSFAIAVLDIDDLKSVNTTYGRDAGDEVIRCYARQILSQFRSYDLVARHKDDEFLLLFPNTQKEGAMRAVEKAQKRAANLYINHKDKNIKVPTFTSVLTTYAPGDQPETLLRRTTEALVQAQRRGRDQVILALPTS